MKLIDALRIANQPKRQDASPFSVMLACGFTPLHFKTLLTAHLQLALPHRTVRVQTGTYGDLAGTVESLRSGVLDQAVVVLEWTDLDPRLGLRHLGGWTSAVLNEILRDTAAQLNRLQAAVLAAGTRVILVLPTLPSLPIAPTPTIEFSSFDLQLQKLVCIFAEVVGAAPSTVVLNPREVDRVSPQPARHDLDADLLAGFPYSRSHADTLASLIVRLVVPPAPKKGLITDLDDTLWLGTLGDDGVDRLSWDLDHKSQMHGVYQQLLRSLADSGVLIGIASKNNAALVEQAFDRRDMILRRTDVFPSEVNWEPKSKSVTQILKAWNIGAESVVFVDDSPMELDEVKATHPDIECLLFPKSDTLAQYNLFYLLRNRFGKRVILDEDRLRTASLRDAPRLRDGIDQPESSFDAFLQSAQSRISFSYTKRPLDPRILELVNKTNQFNLNGRRYSDSEWQRYVDRDESVILLVRYEDKYGPLGKIAVVTGTTNGQTFVVDTWVMSCRAFTRRIEYQTLRELFDRFGVSQIALDFVTTERNAPTAACLARFAGPGLKTPVRIARSEFDKRCPILQHLDELIS